MKKIIYSFILFLFASVQLSAQDSVYIHLKSKPMVKIAIGEIDSIKFEKTVQYSYYISKPSNQNFIHYSTSIPSLNTTADVEMAYNSSGINLNNLVIATASTGAIEKKIADYGMGTAGVNYKFVFSNSFSYMGIDGVTNMNSFIQIQTDGTISIVGGTSAIDRTPVVMVQLQKMSGEVLTQAYIKIKITAPASAQYNYFISKPSGSTFIHYSTTLPSQFSSYDYQISYNNSIPINLNNLVIATASTGSVEKKFSDYGLGSVGVDYKFIYSNSFTYIGIDGITNMNSFIQIQTDGTISVVGGASAIDRTPVVKVQLQKITGEILAVAYIKFSIKI